MSKGMLKKPDWAYRAENDPTKPEWKDKIPHLLWDLGEVFFPLPPGTKGWSYPHHMDEKRFSAQSEVLNGYFDCGWGYGIACAGSLAVVDIDEKEYIEVLTSRLPETAYQWSGSRSGVHLFYNVEGLDQRQNLRIYLKTNNHRKIEGIYSIPKQDRHIGEVKCDPHGYVVGPGSLHPSGNYYGPLQGDRIASISKDELLSALNEFIVDSTDDKWNSHYEGDIDYTEVDNQFYDLTADDVLPWLEPNKRISHPVHGSDTDSNFMKNEKGSFTCWRCNFGPGPGCGVGPRHLLALIKAGDKYGDHACERVRRKWREDSRLHYYAWAEALDRGLIISTNIPYRVAKGYAVENDVIVENEKLAGTVYYDILESLKHQVVSQYPDLPE